MLPTIAAAVRGYSSLFCVIYPSLTSRLRPNRKPCAYIYNTNPFRAGERIAEACARALPISFDDCVEAEAIEAFERVTCRRIPLALMPRVDLLRYFVVGA